MRHALVGKRCNNHTIRRNNVILAGIGRDVGVDSRNELILLFVFAGAGDKSELNLQTILNSEVAVVNSVVDTLTGLILGKELNVLRVLPVKECNRSAAEIGVRVNVVRNELIRGRVGGVCVIAGRCGRRGSRGTVRRVIPVIGTSDYHGQKHKQTQSQCDSSFHYCLPFL